MTIDWKTPLSAIDRDSSQTAVAIKNKVRALGGVYDQVNAIESADHAAWRADVGAQLAARDRAAASVDGLPLTTIDPAHPAASADVIRRRMVKASRPASGASDAVKALLFSMLGAQLPEEPNAFVGNHYPIPHGDYTAALNAALDELAAYVAFA
jgi:hypothetical protein